MTEFNDIRAVAEAAGIAAAERVLDEALRNGLRTPKTWLMAKDCAEDGPYTAETLSRFIAEKRGPKFIPMGGYKMCRRDWWDQWVMNGGPDAFELGPDGKTYRLKKNTDGSDARRASHA